MPLKIEIPDNEIENLNQPAKDELASSVRNYIAEIIGEASRLEAANNTTGRNPQIISSMISDAVLLLRRGYKKRKKPIWLRIIQVISVISAAIFGGMFDYEKMKEPVFVVLLLIVFATALATTIFVFMNE
jgi:hypothetical protein